MSQALTEQTYDEALFNADGLVLVDFWAPWCGPCRMVAPVLDEVSAESGVTLMKVNIDENPGLAARFGIRSIPTILLVKEGEIVDRVVGAAPKRLFQDLVATHQVPAA